MPPTLTVRPATADDAGPIAALYAACREEYPPAFVAGMDLSAADISALQQTGHAFLVAERDGRVVGAVRHRDEEGVASFDLLASAFPGTGKKLVGAVERLAQDRGLRLVRTRVPDGSILVDYFARRGYVGVSRERGADGETMLVVERRVPLLTVREQRREDGEAIAELSGEDPWFFEQMPRPGWFVAADGDRVVGVIGVRDAGGGVARVTSPVLADSYTGRGLELWMIERAAFYAETNGYHSALLPIDERTRPLERQLEDNRWFPEGDQYVRRFGMPIGDEHAE